MKDRKEYLKLKIIKKIDSSYRINIPQEVRDLLNISKNSLIQLEIENNKIILTPIENDSDDNLVTPKSNFMKDSYTELEPNKKPTKTYWENGILKHELIETEPNKITFNKDDVISLRNYLDLINPNKFCGKCGKDLSDEFIEKCKIKINRQIYLF